MVVHVIGLMRLLESSISILIVSLVYEKLSDLFIAALKALIGYFDEKYLLHTLIRIRK